MFIDKKEAQRRVKNSTSVLTRINPNAVKQNGNGSHPSDRETGNTDEAGIDDKTIKNLLGVKRTRGKEMSTRERADLAMTASLLGSDRIAGELLGRGPDSAFELRHGYRSQDKMYETREKDTELVNELDIQKKTIRDLAFDRITSAVGLITHEKLEKLADVTKLARVSRDLVSIVDKTLPKEQAINNGVHFHIWKPEMKEESQYETINVNAPR